MHISHYDIVWGGQNMPDMALILRKTRLVQYIDQLFFLNVENNMGFLKSSDLYYECQCYCIKDRRNEHIQ